jgi:parvulin-like peptidyl-prolyl isomerase
MKISFSARILIYCSALLYVAADLYLFSGPLRKAVDSRKIDSPEMTQRAKQDGIIAVVLGRPITTSQLERAARERVWLEGKSWEDLPKSQRQLIRQACLGDLIDHQLMRSKIAANEHAERATDEEISSRIKLLVARFVSRSDMEQSMKAQGIASEEELRLRIAAIIEQEKYLERQLLPLIEVSDDEIGDFYQQHLDALAMPAMAHVRHIFWATLDKDPAQVQKLAEAALQSLQKKERGFEQIAEASSEDENSKRKGGQLGWLTRTRLPLDFTEPVFVLPLQQPTVLRTKLGWHLVEVTERAEARPRTLEECREEIRLRLAEQKRPQALQNIRTAMRQSHQPHIHIYQSLLEELP